MRSASRLATSLPKASSPRKMLPTPATRMYGRVIGRPIPFLQAGAVRPLQEKRRIDGPGVAAGPDLFPDHHPEQPTNGFGLHSPARWTRWRRFGLRAHCRECPLLSWSQPDTIARPEVRLEDADVFQGSFLFQEAPFPFVHRFSPPNRRRLRTAPWSFINRSEESVSVLSSIWRARSSTRRISCFS